MSLTTESIDKKILIDSWDNECISIIVYNQLIPGSSDLVLFRLLSNYSLLFCSDLAALIFPTLLADIQRSNLKATQSHKPLNVHLNFTPAPSILLLQSGIVLGY